MGRAAGFGLASGPSRAASWAFPAALWGRVVSTAFWALRAAVSAFGLLGLPGGLMGQYMALLGLVLDSC